jgi:hypothetical protein
VRVTGALRHLRTLRRPPKASPPGSPDDLSSRSCLDRYRSLSRHSSTGLASTSCTGTVPWQRCGGPPAQKISTSAGCLQERGRPCSELKTTTVIRPGVHEVMVDVGQLWDYRLRPLGRQPFYAFPRPGSGWEGT